MNVNSYDKLIQHNLLNIFLNKWDKNEVSDKVIEEYNLLQ